MNNAYNKIPYGPYCYEGKHKCPYWELKTDENNEPVGYCAYLNEYDYILLSDQCKICGINELVIKNNIWTFIWNFCEDNNIALGKFAPFVFGKMINRKGSKIE